MTMRIRQIASSLSLLFGFVACGGSDDPNSPGVDAAPDSNIDAAPAPEMIAITGTATSRSLSGAMPQADVTITVYRNSDERTPIATATTNAQGAFTLTVPTGGVALEGFVKATKSGFKDTYLYPPSPIAADTAAPINMLTPSDYNLLSSVTSGGQAAGQGLVALVVVDGASASATPVGGATVSIEPASTSPKTAYRYNNAQGSPNASATVTHTDGIAYIFNVPPSVAATVGATKAGATFTRHYVKAWPDQITTTLVTP